MDDKRKQPTHGNVNWNLLTSWPVIVAAFMFGFWPVGLFLIFKSATLDEERRKAQRSAAAPRTTSARTASTASQTATASKVTRSTAKTTRTTKAKPKTPGKGAGVWLMILGAVFAFSGIAATADTLDMIHWAGSFAGYLSDLWMGLTMLTAGGGMLGLGLFRRAQQRRFPRYLAFINNRRAVSFREIASAMGLSRRKVIRDLEKMLDDGLLPKGAYLDMGREFYFAGADAVPEEKPVEKAQPKAETVDEYGAILRSIRELNDRIADEELSAQIDRIEDISRKIFREVERSPEKKSQISTLLNYYLPTTQKLLDSYATFEAAGVEGSNMTQAKERIESTMSRIVQGFEKQLDQLYSVDLMDVESDIRVMENMLNRDGAGVEKDFELRL